jgi:hypothetical protein
MVVLRADKLLTTSRMGRLDFERLVGSPDEVLPALERFGVGYVVIERHDDRPYPDGPLRWLENLAAGDEFELVANILVSSSDRRMAHAFVSVYRYKGETRAADDAVVSISVPAMNDRIGVRLRDLTGTVHP